LFTLAPTNCVYRLISYQQNRKPIPMYIGTVPDENLLLFLPDNNLTISLPARRIKPALSVAEWGNAGVRPELFFYLLLALMR